MNKEIEILKHMIEFYKKFCDGEEELNPIATGKEIKAIEKLLSYIEQLEKKVDKYENPDDLTLFYMWLDTLSKDKMKQMETEILKLKQHNSMITKLAEQLENNRDKAIKYIKIELSQSGERELRDLVDGYEVLKLLKGDSDD